MTDEKKTEEAKAPEGKVYRLRAPDKVKGTNWRERFYNEQVPVRDRVAEVRRPMNAKDLERRGWTLIDGEDSEENNANAAREAEEKANLFAKNFAELIEEAKELPESDELNSVIELSEKALEEAESERDMFIACRAMTDIMDKVKADEKAAEGDEEKDGEESKPEDKTAGESKAEEPKVEETKSPEESEKPSEEKGEESPKAETEGEKPTEESKPEEKKESFVDKVKKKLKKKKKG